MLENTTMVQRVKLTQTAGWLLNNIRLYFRDEPLLAIDVMTDEILAEFHDLHTFLEAWYCGYYVEDTGEVSLY